VRVWEWRGVGGRCMCGVGMAARSHLLLLLPACLITPSSRTHARSHARTQPAILFVGDAFESQPDFKLAKSMLLDMFRGQQVRQPWGPSRCAVACSVLCCAVWRPGSDLPPYRTRPPNPPPPFHQPHKHR
jgi:hypothetical protein